MLQFTPKLPKNFFFILRDLYLWRDLVITSWGNTDVTGAWYFVESESLVKHVSQGIVSCRGKLYRGLSLRYKRQDYELRVKGI